MKTILLKQVLFLLLLSIFLVGCELLSTQDIEPGISIYKTKGDYFDLVDIGMKGDSIFRRSSFSNDRSKLIISNTDTIYKHRVKLVNGYILDFEADERHDVFLNLTFMQQLNYEIKYNSPTLPDDTLKKYILNKSPYSEFYREIGNHKKFNFPDTTELNNIIKNGQIEQYFKRII